MIHSAGFSALLDANVLYRAAVRDYILHLASENLYQPKWSDKIHDEWIRSLLKKRPDLQEHSLIRAKNAMNDAFPNATITGYGPVLNRVQLPDEGDRHILAAAIKGKTAVIVTFNIKHFPTAILNKVNLEVQHPDKFVGSLIDSDGLSSLRALKALTSKLKNPPKSVDEVLANLCKAGLPVSVNKLRRLLVI